MSMQYSSFVSILEISFHFAFPILIYAGLLIGYFRPKIKEFLKSCLIDKRVLTLLTLGTLSTSFINIPIFISINTMLAVNVGTIIIPIILATIFLYKIRPNKGYCLLSIVVISLISYLLSYLDPVFGIVSDFPWYLLPVLVSVILAVLHFPNKPQIAVPFAYSISIFGVLIGVDLLRLPAIINQDIIVGYIGGLGIFDLIFVSGLFTMALSLIITYPLTAVKFIPGKALHSPQPKSGSKLESYLLKNNRYSSIIPRLVAFGIDCIIQGLIFFLLFFIILVFHNFNYSELLMSFWGFTLFWWAIFFHIIYFTIFEWYFGQTPGKRFTKIKVISLESSTILGGNRARTYYLKHDFLSVFTRNVLRIIDLILFIFNIVRFTQLPKRQRFGDLLAGTVVIKI